VGANPVSEIPFLRDLRFEYEVLETISPAVRRIVARNPSPFTAYGTGTYVIGHGKVAVIDPGPAIPEHVNAILQALRGESIDSILITHTHLDHSPAAAAVTAATGAKTYGYGPHGSPPGPSAEEGADRDFVPDITLRHGETLSVGDLHVTAVHTPGHTSNHLCFALGGEDILFTGDHVMGWSTTVISPPDGDMTDYMNSLDLLLQRDDALYVPTHGPAIPNPKPFVKSLVEHRLKRRAALLQQLSNGVTSIKDIVDNVYVGLNPALHGAAARSVLAHMIELVARNEVMCDGKPEITSRYSLP
jgi:glyoxylase-like metal-dependent hydrolase (beta-lactamase superfamily II)